MEFFSPDESYLQQIKNMCAVCFEMDKEEVDFVLDSKYISTEICYAVKQGEKLCSILFTVPCTMFYDNDKVKGHYIYGACTLPEYRHQGIMHKLIEYALLQSVKKGHCFSALLPANELLYNFYAELGYRPLFTAYNAIIDVKDLPFLSEDIPFRQINDSSFIQQVREAVCKEYIGTVEYNQKTYSYACAYAQRYGGGTVECKKGYILYAYNDENQMVVLELMCKNKDINIMLGLLRKICNSDKLYLRLPPWLARNYTTNNQNIDTFGMVKILNNSIDTSEFITPYLGFTFD